MIKELFEFTRNKAEKCIVFIDEIDSICRKRNNREGDHTRR
jgi:ATP-dependent 26S proteasome regulatory subunit